MALLAFVASEVANEVANEVASEVASEVANEVANEVATRQRKRSQLIPVNSLQHDHLYVGLIHQPVNYARVHRHRPDN